MSDSTDRTLKSFSIFKCNSLSKKTYKQNQSNNMSNFNANKHFYKNFNLMLMRMLNYCEKYCRNFGDRMVRTYSAWNTRDSALNPG